MICGLLMGFQHGDSVDFEKQFDFLYNPYILNLLCLFSVDDIQM